MDAPDPDSRNQLADDCQRCPALVDSRERISWGNGPPDADVLVVGEAPGYGDPDAEEWQGGNWTGMAYTSSHSGRRIRELVADVGYENAYYTNAVKCFPADGDDPTTNREPTATERANCQPYLRQEIETVDPAAVVATGKHATQSVLAMDDRGLDGFVETVLSPIELRALDTTLVPLFHPSYQDVWLSRIGHTADSYRETLAATLAEI